MANMNYVDHLDLFGVPAKEIPCIKFEGPPTESTVGAVGLFGMDTLTGDVWKCTAVDGGKYNWTRLVAEEKFDPTVYGLPILKLTGDTSAMTKENPVDLQYVYGDRTGTASVKWQGSSSLSYPKKNYTIKFDNAFEAAPGWGEQKKYCLKANYIDHSHARNVVSAKLWGQIVKSRASYNGVFDVSKITGLLHQDFTQVYNWSNYMSISEDGIMTLSGTLYNNGYFGFQGANLSKGTYEISFDYIMPTTVEEDPGGALNVTIYGDNGEFSERIVYAPSRNEWVSTTVQLEAKSDNNMLCINMYSYHNNDRPYSVRNLKIIGNNTYTNVTSTLYALPNGGAIDGFPVVITLNGDFHGLYTFNIPKDGWMFGMGQSESEAILCADYSEACWFRAEATLDNDFDLEYVSDENSSDWVANSVNRLIRECMNSDGSNLDTTIAQYLDWESAIDYVIFKALINGIDMAGKNYILGTYDGVKWFFSAYDMDCVYGLDWDGKRFYNTRGMSPIFRDHTIDSLILDYKKEALKTRYTQLRSTIMSVDNVITTFINFIGNIPSPLYEEDVRRWPSIPNSSTNNIAQIIDQYTRNSKYVDEFIEAL